MKVDVLGVKIDDVTMNQALEIVHGWLKKGGKHYIVTTNPEFIVTAQQDQTFKKILNDADLSIPDGVGLNLTGKVKNRISGTDLMEKLVDKSREWGATIGLLGGQNGVAEKVAECLLRKYPKLKISFASGDIEVDEDGREVDKNGNVITRNAVTRQSNSEDRHARLAKQASLAMTRGCDILFVALGHPKQEKWIAQNLPKIPVKVAMGVGGAFDYLSGKVPRAPKWMRDLGWEWLSRLIIQPWRIKRQLSLIRYLLLLLNQK